MDDGVYATARCQYLAGKRGSEIPVLAQILAVADYADRHLRWGESTEMVRGKIKEREKMCIRDRDYCDSIRNIITTQEVNAEFAVATTGDNFAAMFAGMDDEYMKADVYKRQA